MVKYVYAVPTKPLSTLICSSESKGESAALSEDSRSHDKVAESISFQRGLWGTRCATARSVWDACWAQLHRLVLLCRALFSLWDA